MSSAILRIFAMSIAIRTASIRSLRGRFGLRTRDMTAATPVTPDASEQELPDQERTSRQGRKFCAPLFCCLILPITRYVVFLSNLFSQYTQTSRNQYAESVRRGNRLEFVAVEIVQQLRRSQLPLR